MTNLSQQKREAMLAYLSKLKDLHGDDESLHILSQIETEINEKRYGLIWEEHSEHVDQMLVDNIPVFVDVPEKTIVATSEEKFNFLLEGDNLHSLKLLLKTHREKIDFIYIDPPYNTGNKDFVYNDACVESTDSYSHSKWLSFIEKRLKVSHALLNKKGIIFISIDDNEQAQLKLLCDSVFGQHNFIACLPTIMNLKGNQDQFGFAGTHEYTLVYTKDINEATFNQFKIDVEELQEWSEDEKGVYKQGATLKSSGINAPREKRPNLYYPLLVKGDKVYSITEEEFKAIYNKDTKEFNDAFVSDLVVKYESEGYKVILPTLEHGLGSWRWQYSKTKTENDELIVSYGKNNSVSIYKKQRPELDGVPTKKAKSLFYKPEYSSGNGTAQIKKLFGEKIFNNPKPLELIKDFLTIGSNTNSIILDFFAGSGTTGHAVQQLNKEDGGNRTYILCTNNENNICQEVTYQRLAKIQEELPHNLRYYRTDFVPKYNAADEDFSVTEATLEHIRELIELEHQTYIDGIRNALLLDNDEKEYVLLNVADGANVYASSWIFLETEDLDLIEEKGINLVYVPDYYFEEELIEVGEL